MLVALVMAFASPQAAPAAHGPHGPDAFGYTADSVRFTFKDISKTGATVLNNLDDAVVPVPIGFAFSFYGISHTTVFVSTNGLLTFGAGNPFFQNEDFIGPIFPDLPTIAPLWDDWVTNCFEIPLICGPMAKDDRVLVKTVGQPGERQFIVQWHVVPHFPTSSPVTFQAVLFEETSAIEFRYLDTDTGGAVDDFDGNGADFGGSATVGIRDVAGHLSDRFLQWSFMQPVIRNRTAVLFCAPNDDDDNDGLTNVRESILGTLLDIADSDGDGIMDGNDDANGNGEDDEDEDDDDECPDRDSDGDGVDDEDEDD